jgi:hypothetical protein
MCASDSAGVSIRSGSWRRRFSLLAIVLRSQVQAYQQVGADSPCG